MSAAVVIASISCCVQNQVSDSCRASLRYGSDRIPISGYFFDHRPGWAKLSRCLGCYKSRYECANFNVVESRGYDLRATPEGMQFGCKECISNSTATATSSGDILCGSMELQQPINQMAVYLYAGEMVNDPGLLALLLVARNICSKLYESNQCHSYASTPDDVAQILGTRK